MSGRTHGRAREGPFFAAWEGLGPVWEGVSHGLGGRAARRLSRAGKTRRGHGGAGVPGAPIPPKPQFMDLPEGSHACAEGAACQKPAFEAPPKRAVLHEGGPRPPLAFSGLSSFPQATGTPPPLPDRRISRCSPTQLSCDTLQMPLSIPHTAACWALVDSFFLRLDSSLPLPHSVLAAPQEGEGCLPAQTKGTPCDTSAFRCRAFASGRTPRRGCRPFSPVGRAAA